MKQGISALRSKYKAGKGGKSLHDPKDKGGMGIPDVKKQGGRGAARATAVSLDEALDQLANLDDEDSDIEEASTPV